MNLPFRRQRAALTPRRSFAVIKHRSFSRQTPRPNAIHTTLTVSPTAKLKPLRRRLSAARLRNAVLLLVFVCCLGLGAAYAYSQKVWQVKQVRVEGKVEVLGTKTSELQARLTGANLLTLDSDKYISELRQDPYVKTAYIKKEYPGTLILAVEEVEPHTYVYSLNASVLYGADGQVLAQQTADDNYPMSEVERLIFINEQPFRSPVLKDRWLADNLEQQRNAFKTYKEILPEADRLQKIEALLTAGKISSPEQYSETMEFNDFVDNNFRNTSLNRLERSYNQIRSEILVTTDKRWHELQTAVPPQPDKIVIYSLVEAEEVNNLGNLIASGYFSQLQTQVAEQFNLQKLVIISPVTVKLQAQGLANEQLDLLFSTQKPLEQQMVELRTILATLASQNRGCKKIDLTGKKLVVS